MTARANCGTSVAPIPIPVIAMPSARPRRSSNHDDTALAYGSGACPALSSPTRPAIAMNADGEGGVSDSDPSDSAKSTIDVSETRRIPYRSMARPRKGYAAAAHPWPTSNDEENVARSHPNSFVTGPRNNPNVKNTIGPLPTINPTVDPNTTHHGFFSLGGAAATVMKPVRD